MTLGFVLLPAAAALAAYLLRRGAARLLPVLLAACAAAHAALAAWCWADRGRFPPAGPWLAVDEPGLLFLTVTSLLFLAVAVNAAGSLRRELRSLGDGSGPGSGQSGAAQAVFTACLLGFLATMSLATLSQHFGLLWVAVEATTLLSAPLIHHHRHQRSLEATWKYLLLCSVGIAVALLGTYFLAAAVDPRSQAGTHLTFAGLRAADLDPRWLKAAFLLLLVGYGTKMGLAPLHTWLPDAHSEAPSAVSALLSGALLNCAFLALLRVQSVCAAAGIGEFGRQNFLVLGLVSMAVAGGLLIRQPDYKRLLAYSSVEHMGILAVGVGLGAGWGVLFHAANHSLVKGALFLLSGNILAAYGSKKEEQVRALASRLPVTGALWLVGFFAITGAPPFGLFLSELSILRAAVGSRAWFVAAAYSLLLAVAFVGMVPVFVRMSFGRAAPDGGATDAVPGPIPGGTLPGGGPTRDIGSATLASLLLLACSAAVGVWLPPALGRVLGEAVGLLGVRP